MARLRIGSRGSQLALWQANHISALLRERGHEVELEIIKTTGDKITDVALAKVGTKGMFTKEIEEALAEGRVDLAVHSLKDLPTELPPGFELVAITTRVNPRDVFLSVKYDSVRCAAERRARRHQQPAATGAVEGRRGPTWIFIRCAATSIRACASWKRASTTPSFWRPPD